MAAIGRLEIELRVVALSLGAEPLGGLRELLVAQLLSSAELGRALERNAKLTLAGPVPLQIRITPRRTRRLRCRLSDGHGGKSNDTDEQRDDEDRYGLRSHRSLLESCGHDTQNWVVFVSPVINRAPRWNVR